MVGFELKIREIEPMKIQNLLFFAAICLLLLFLNACQDKEDYALILTEEQLCELNSLIPASIIYERLDVNRQHRFISCYHTPMGLVESDTTVCIFPNQRFFENSAFGFYFLGIDIQAKKRLFGVQILAPVWSTDGQWLMWSNNQNIYKMPLQADTLDYNSVVQLTRDSVLLLSPLWSPTGKNILVKAELTDKGKDFRQDGFYVLNDLGKDIRLIDSGEGEAVWRSENEVIILKDKLIYRHVLTSGSTTELYDFGDQFQNIRNPKISSYDGRLYFLARSEGEDFLTLRSMDLERKAISTALNKRVMDYSFLSAGELIVIQIENQISVVNLFTPSDGRLKRLYDYERL